MWNDALLCLELGRLATARRGGCVTEPAPAPAHVLYFHTSTLILDTDFRSIATTGCRGAARRLVAATAFEGDGHGITPRLRRPRVDGVFDHVRRLRARRRRLRYLEA